MQSQEIISSLQFFFFSPIFLGLHLSENFVKIIHGEHSYFNCQGLLHTQFSVKSGE